jgi:hypothetical protein
MNLKKLKSLIVLFLSVTSVSASANMTMSSPHAVNNEIERQEGVPYEGIEAQEDAAPRVPQGELFQEQINALRIERLKGPLVEYRERLLQFNLAEEARRNSEKHAYDEAKHNFEMKRSLYNHELGSINITLRRVVKILEGRYGGLEKIPHVATILNELIEILQEGGDVNTLKHRLKQLAITTGTIKSALKNDLTLPSPEEISFQLHSLRTENLVCSKVIDLLDTYYNRYEKQLSACGIQLGMGAWLSGSVGFALGKGSDSLGRNDITICTTLGCGMGIGPTISGVYLKGRAQSGWNSPKRTHNTPLHLIIGGGVTFYNKDQLRWTEAGLGLNTEVEKSLHVGTLCKLGINYDQLKISLGILTVPLQAEWIAGIPPVAP